MKPIKFLCITLSATALLLPTFGCSSSPAADNRLSVETTAEPTGKSGLTKNDVEMFFSEHVPDASSISCHINDSGIYTLDFSLSSDRSELVTNYDEFALSIKDACALFSKTYSAEAKIFTILFFNEGDVHIYWMSFDGGKSGTLTEQYSEKNKTEKTLTFDQLVDYYAQQK